jgi:streptogramin lyase
MKCSMACQAPVPRRRGLLWHRAATFAPAPNLARGSVFRVSTAGTLTPYRIPPGISSTFATYLGTADGSLWFANESGAPKIGRITASGVATSYSLAAFVRGGFPFDAMAVGEDGNLYALDNGNTTATVYRLTPSKIPLGR